MLCSVAPVIRRSAASTTSTLKPDSANFTAQCNPAKPPPIMVHSTPGTAEATSPKGSLMRPPRSPGPQPDYGESRMILAVKTHHYSSSDRLPLRQDPKPATPPTPARHRRVVSLCGAQSAANHSSARTGACNARIVQRNPGPQFIP